MLKPLNELYEEIKSSKGKKEKIKTLRSYQLSMEKIIKEYNSLIEIIEKNFPKFKGIFEKAINPPDIYGYEGVFDSCPDLSEYAQKYYELTSALNLLYEIAELTPDEVHIPEWIQ